MKTLLLSAAAAATTLLAQQPFNYDLNYDLAFQTSSWNFSTAGGQVIDEAFNGEVVKGKPFSATEERHFLQVLGDGNRIETTQTNRIYRDADGRTRVEEMNGTVTIDDPVAHTHYRLDPATKTARQDLRGTIFVTGPNNSIRLNTYRRPSGVRTTVNRQDPALKDGVTSETTEDLGSQNVNGIMADGMRTTMTIPKGKIGNSREIKIMTEHWTSPDLQMLVKSVNNDPRFGDTTYQLTKITQSAPDPALFQLPGDYTVTNAGSSPLRLTPRTRLKQK